MKTPAEVEQEIRDRMAAMTRLALCRRAESGTVPGCASAMDDNDESFLLIIPQQFMLERVQALTQFVRAVHAQMFVFVFDGYANEFNRDAPCPSCVGRGCETCMGSGLVLKSRREAIYAIGMARWGFSTQSLQLYEMVDGQLRVLDLIRPETTIYDPYRDVFSPSVVH